MQLTCYNIGCIIIFSLTEAFVNGKPEFLPLNALVPITYGQGPSAA